MPRESFHPEPEPEEKRKIVIVEASDVVKDKARDVAEAKFFEPGIGGVKGFASRVWKQNLFYEYYRQKEIGKAKKEILDTGDIYIHEDDAEGAHDATMKKIVEQFTSEYDEAVHKEAGEMKEILGESESELEIKKQIKKLISDFSSKDLSDESVSQSFIEEKNRIFSAIKGEKSEIVHSGELYADNLLEVVKEIQQNVEHGEKLEDIDLDFDVVVGKAKSGVRTEAQFNAVDNVVDKIQNTKIGRFANEATIAGAVSIAHSLTAGLSRRMANSRLFAWGSFGASAVLGAGIAGLREKKRLEEERRQHGREMAMGKTFPLENSKRRILMEEFRYETRDSEALASTLERSLYNVDENGTRELRDLSGEEFRVAVADLSEVEARIKLSDRENIDLISYSDVTKIGEERLKLDILRAQAKVDLRKLVEKESIEKGVVIPKDKSLDKYLSSLVETRINSLVTGDEGMEKRDALFASMRKKQVAKAVVKGLVAGMTIGAGVQEAGALFTNQHGVIEGIRGTGGGRVYEDGKIHMTSLEYLRRYFSDTLPRADIASLREVAIGNSLIKIPEDITVINNPDGSFDLMRGDEVVGNDILMNSNGNLDVESINNLKDSGVLTNSTIQTITETKEMALDASDYVSAHKDEMTNIHRELWYDNDTPKPVFDKNELKLWWGGEKGTGIDKDGNYVYNIKHMTEKGSYHGKFSAEALELAKEGKLRMMLSLSRDTQQHVFSVPIDGNFNAVIDPDSEVGKLLFANVDGKAKLLAKFAEIAEVTGIKNEVTQVKILATDVGLGLDTVNDLVPVPKDVPVTIFDFPSDYRVDPPPFIPIFSRPAEPTEKKGIYFR